MVTTGLCSMDFHWVLGYCRVVRIRSTVLTQPGTPVSFQGMFICLLFDFQKLRIFRCFPFLENSGTPTFPISGNSGLRHFPRFSYYVILLVSCLHPSLVTPLTSFHYWKHTYRAHLPTLIATSSNLQPPLATVRLPSRRSSVAIRS